MIYLYKITFKTYLIWVLNHLHNLLKNHHQVQLSMIIYINYQVKVAVDASLIIYQQLLRHQLLKNKKGEITNHITGLFYKLTNYLSLNIELIFVFDGKPPDLKQECVNLTFPKTTRCQRQNGCM